MVEHLTPVFVDDVLVEFDSELPSPSLTETSRFFFVLGSWFLGRAEFLGLGYAGSCCLGSRDRIDACFCFLCTINLSY
jgi:hypothetical protein